MVLALAFLAVQRTAKFLLGKINKYEERQQAKERHNNNIYINYHKFKSQNDASYQEYLDWLDKTNTPGVPADKIKFKEDEKAKAEFDRLFKKDEKRN